MKMVRFNGGATGVLAGKADDRVIDVWASLDALPAQWRSALAAHLPVEGRGSWEAMIAQWPSLRDGFAMLVALGESGSPAVVSLDLATIALEAPLPSRERRIFSLGANTIEHIQAASAQLASTQVTPEAVFGPKQAGASPVGFNVMADSVVGPGALITPPAFTQKLDYEGECAVIMGAQREDGDWRKAIWGLVTWSDFGIRDGHLGMLATTPSFGYSLNLWKNFDSANACGPFVVIDENLDLGNIRCQAFVNGELRQDWNTKEMIYSFEEALANIDRFMPLKPGDMLTSGTGAGSALESPVDSPLWLEPGDVVEIVVEGAGTLRNVVATWQ